jgi:hypothetical protein
MAPVTLPPSFFNSFWSPDYRSGLEVLFKQLDQVGAGGRNEGHDAATDPAQGCKANDEVAEFIEVGDTSSVILLSSN